jgi:hypothetical protein
MVADDVMVRRALSPRIGTVCTALDEMIRRRRWLLDDIALCMLEARGIEHIDAWIFDYRTMSLPDDERSARIGQGLAAGNARIREHACDLAGDLGLSPLKDALRGLFDDEDDAVREAARCNVDMLGA